MSSEEEHHLVTSSDELTFRRLEDEVEEVGDDVASGMGGGERKEQKEKSSKKMEFVNQNFVESTEDEADLSTPTAIGPPLGAVIRDGGDETPTAPDPSAKYSMAQTKDGGDLSRPAGLPNNGNPSSSSSTVIPPPAAKSGPAAASSKGTPVAPLRNRRRKVSRTSKQMDRQREGLQIPGILAEKWLENV
ncbi:hypothetical protein L5515_013285 [Caenorhabditis briggsae]|uniref:Uncharacterized protein n=1 Tax=Caenorhabditis briggsae TaxID=6238 RepID=A0AAE9DHG1_CAEBR|nr:hypothetical protein L3Y34_017143 [Caenorhabditis briggsae]UMM16149.1 hypothetical protein L5515_013285 [Caenorhabditis briggsae]